METSATYDPRKHIKFGGICELGLGWVWTSLDEYDASTSELAVTAAKSDNDSLPLPTLNSSEIFKRS
jgi:hypothetical protein